MAEINRIAFAVRDGKASPAEAKQLMEEFVRHDAQNPSIPSPEFRRLIHHFAHCFAHFLNNDRTIEHALGLRRKMGHPEAEERKRIKLATEVLRRRLGGMTHQTALEEVSAKFHCAQSVIGGAFHEHYPTALVLIREERRKEQEAPERYRPANW